MFDIVIVVNAADVHTVDADAAAFDAADVDAPAVGAAVAGRKKSIYPGDPV
ncbi:MAG: hypothetical protein P4L51_06935 [Puia sp.]|nr:hypothetical protein [Puia sp.]